MEAILKRQDVHKLLTMDEKWLLCWLKRWLWYSDNHEDDDGDDADDDDDDDDDIDVVEAGDTGGRGRGELLGEPEGGCVEAAL